MIRAARLLARISAFLLGFTLVDCGGMSAPATVADGSSVDSATNADIGGTAGLSGQIDAAGGTDDAGGSGGLPADGGPLSGAGGASGASGGVGGTAGLGVAGAGGVTGFGGATADGGAAGSSAAGADGGGAGGSTLVPLPICAAGDSVCLEDHAQRCEVPSCGASVDPSASADWSGNCVDVPFAPGAGISTWSTKDGVVAYACYRPDGSGKLFGLAKCALCFNSALHVAFPGTLAKQCSLKIKGPGGVGGYYYVCVNAMSDCPGM
jgi:hypothetical protein